MPFGITFGGVDAEDVRTGLNEGGDTLFVVSRVDAGADDIGLVLVEELQLVFVMGVIVLPPLLW